MVQDERYMKRCLDLATLGASTVSPNPMVGAVILHDGIIIGEGYTSPYGGSHAEVNAIQDAYQKLGKAEARNRFCKSTMYVSLEPCSHFGKTPPCADMLVELQFERVVIGCLDTFSKVNGEGFKKLQGAGIDAIVGVLEKACLFVNRRFFTRIQQQRPYVILKWAQTLDGLFSPEDAAQQWISNIASKQLVHKWRGEEDAILVGTSTALIDNPSLTTRLWNGKNPKRILIDKELAVPTDAAIFNEEAETIIFNAHQTDWQKNRKFIALEHFDLYLPQQLLYQLYLMDVQSLIVEGGAKTLQSFIDAGMWDEARVFVSQNCWGQGKLAPRLTARVDATEKVGDDELRFYFNRKV